MKQKQEKSAGGSTRGLRCQLDTTQTERGRERHRKRDMEWEREDKRR